jgi:GntR family transcriptional regulator, transcriptional repressor for pyruvate dehydrogenase complex
MTPPKSSTDAAPALAAGSHGELFSRLNVGRISGMIVDQIRLLVRDGHLAPGDRLPSERELCERFGVSRVTVREALRVLEANGLITIKVGARGGAFITTPSSERVGEGIADLLTLSSITAAEVTEARRVFELGIMPLACERAKEEDVSALLEICDRSDAALAQDRYTMDLSAEFHIRVARATHNAAIEMLVQSFHGPMLMSLRRAKIAAPLMGHVGTGEHRSIAEAIARRDVSAATEVMATHLARTAERLQVAGDTELLGHAGQGLEKV